MALLQAGDGSGLGRCCLWLATFRQCCCEESPAREVLCGLLARPCDPHKSKAPGSEDWDEVCPSSGVCFHSLPFLLSREGPLRGHLHRLARSHGGRSDFIIPGQGVAWFPLASSLVCYENSGWIDRLHSQQTNQISEIGTEQARYYF